MAFWRNLFSGWNEPQTTPAWAGFFSLSQFRHFKRLVDGYFSRKRVPYQWGEGIITLEQGEHGSQHQLGLVNLAQICARNEEKEWGQIVEDHFTTLERSQTEQRALEQRLDDFDRVAELLAVRLWPEDYLGELDPERMIHRREIPGVVSALVYDLPSSIRNVTPEEVKDWGRDEDELFKIGLENIRETCIPDVSVQDLGEGVEVTVFSDESFFVASHALLLEDHPDSLGSFGALVGIPHRHVLLTYPIESLKVVDAIPRLIAIISGMEREGPGSISSRLYWYQDGDFVDLPYHIEKNTLNFSPPVEFMEMLNLLGEGEVDEEHEEEST